MHTDLDEHYQDAKLGVDVVVRNRDDRPRSFTVTGRLYDQRGRQVVDARQVSLISHARLR